MEVAILKLFRVDAGDGVGGVGAREKRLVGKELLSCTAGMQELLTRTCPQLHMSGVARARPFGSMTVHFPPSALAARASGTSMGQALTTNHYLLTLMSL
ncbi:hypothetical protein HYQ46_003820 [Verticillium longisporum]|nr:hypothetical protein HYQ46_003820 [Verticillium longisporum]